MRELTLIATVLSTLIGCSSSAPATKGSPSGPTVQQRNAEVLVERAAEYGLRGDLKGAVALLDEALRINPQDATAWGARATAVRKLGDFQRAIQDATKAIEIDPKFAGAYCQRAFAYQQSELENRVEQSLADASKAIELDPTSSLSFIIRGNARHELREYAGAVADFTKAIELNPRSYSAYSGRALGYSALGDLGKARDDINKALSLNPPKGDQQSLQAIRKALEKQR
ncbi:MAG TPA: tetratricopeptide repeat protein [Pyrinomonadaceae bacterium]|nr:tetratricopeptide repeat protein [Pyrinomonadaceae bacterium]